MILDDHMTHLDVLVIAYKASPGNFKLILKNFLSEKLSIDWIIWKRFTSESLKNVSKFAVLIHITLEDPFK